jgi:O-antigen/teichoic acid export membrane protein
VILAARDWPRVLRPRLPIMREIAALAAPMALYVVSSQLLVNLDLWSLKSLWTDGGEIVGYYVASVNVARTLTVIPAAQVGVLFATVAWAIASQSIARARHHLREATRFVVVVTTVSCVVLSVDAAEVLSVLFSSAYSDGQRFLHLQLAALGLFALLEVFAHALMAVGRQWFVATTIAAIVPLACLSNYLLISQLGPIGAATSLLLAVSVGTAVTGAVAHHHFGSLIRISTIVRVAVAAIVVGLVSVAIPVRGPLVIVKLALLGGGYLLVLKLLGEVSAKDLGLTE